MMKMYVWSNAPFWLAVAQAESVDAARKALLDTELGDSGDGSCPVHDKAREMILGENPTIWYGTNAEFAITDSAAVEEADAETAKWKAALAKEELDHSATIRQRDYAEEWADRLAYSIGGEKIGEHSNLNNPWQNALDILDQSKPDGAEALQAQLDAANRRIAELERMVAVMECSRINYIWRDGQKVRLIETDCGAMICRGAGQTIQMALLDAADRIGIPGGTAAPESAPAKDRISRLLNVARGCHDYGGGYRENQRESEIFHHGIQTVINALEAAAKNDPLDLQVNVLEAIGSAPAKEADSERK